LLDCSLRIETPMLGPSLSLKITHAAAAALFLVRARATCRAAALVCFLRNAAPLSLLIAHSAAAHAIVFVGLPGLVVAAKKLPAQSQSPVRALMPAARIRST